MLETICKKCGRKMNPIFNNHIFNGSEAILHGGESIKNGSEQRLGSNAIVIKNYKCPYCDAIHKNGVAKKVK